MSRRKRRSEWAAVSKESCGPLSKEIRTRYFLLGDVEDVNDARGAPVQTTRMTMSTEGAVFKACTHI